MPAERLSDSDREAIRETLAPVNPVLSYLFGSHGTARQHPGSDVDLAVLFDQPLEPLARLDLAGRLSDRLGRTVDLVDLSEASTVMRKEVLRTGERLAASDPRVAADFEMRVLADYARLNEERAAVIAG